MTNCLNCGHSFKGKYCPECGQKAEIERYSAKVVLAEMLHFFTHFEKGFLHTLWNFIVKPGVTSIKFLKGKRKQYQPPVSYLFICTGLYLIIHNYIVTHFQYHVSADVISSMNMEDQANVLLRTHFTPFILIVIIASAFIIYLVLAKPKFNFVEIFIISLYGGGTYMMMLLLSDIVLGFIFKINVITQPVFLWQTTLSSLYNFWFCCNFFSKLKLHLFWIRLIATALLVAAVGFVLFIYLPLAWVYLFEK